MGIKIKYINKFQLSLFRFGLLAILSLTLIFAASCSNDDNSANLEDAALAAIKTVGEESPTDGDIVEYASLIEKDIVYKTAVTDNGMADLKLDIYYPTTRIYYNSPTIVAFHGGAWVSGNKSDIVNSLSPLFNRLREHGYIVVTVQYRFASDVIYFPDNFEDCIDAILFLAENKDKYHIDPNAIGVTGYSAGAHLAMMCSYAMKDFSATGNYIDLSYCVSFAGPTKMYDDDTSAYSQSILYMLRGLFNGTYEEKPDNYKVGSPYNYLSKESQTPLMLIQGNRDDTVPYSQAQVMYERLAEFGIPSEFITLENTTHNINLNYSNMFSSPTVDELVDAVESFVYKYTPVK